MFMGKSCTYIPFLQGPNILVSPRTSFPRVKGLSFHGMVSSWDYKVREILNPNTKLRLSGVRQKKEINK